MTESEAIDTAKKRLGKRSIVLVGLMGCGKSSIGKRLAARLGLPFIDADEEIERAAAKTDVGLFVRSLVGVDMTDANDEFAGFSDVGG